MPAVSGQKICQPFRVGKYDDDFGSENMSAISGQKKCQHCQIGIKCWQNWAGKKCQQVQTKMLAFWVGKNGRKTVIAGDLTGLIMSLHIVGI